MSFTDLISQEGYRQTETDPRAHYLFPLDERVYQLVDIGTYLFAPSNSRASSSIALYLFLALSFFMNFSFVYSTYFFHRNRRNRYDNRLTLFRRCFPIFSGPLHGPAADESRHNRLKGRKKVYKPDYSYHIFWAFFIMEKTPTTQLRTDHHVAGLYRRLEYPAEVFPDVRCGHSVPKVRSRPTHISKMEVAPRSSSPQLAPRRRPVANKTEHWPLFTLAPCTPSVDSRQIG
jgi:hypothetical protein